jgi:hypothetical protein
MMLSLPKTSFLFSLVTAASATSKDVRIDGSFMKRSLQADTNVTVTSAKGDTLVLYPQTLENARNFIYCELVFNYGDLGSDIYSTSPVAPCDVNWWDNLDVDALAAEFGAESLTKNGPQYWSMDFVRVLGSEPFNISGVMMPYGSLLPPGTVGQAPYTIFYPAKNQLLIWQDGLPTYRLTDNLNNVFIVQGYKVPESELATLGEDFTDLPPGWQYEVVDVTGGNLSITFASDAPIASTSDEFDQIYALVINGTADISGAVGKTPIMSLIAVAAVAVFTVAALI